MADYIKGEILVLYVWDDAIYRPVACLTSNGLSESVGVIETQTKCSPGVTEKEAGTYSYEISLEGNYIDTTSAGSEITKASHDFLKGIMRAKTLITWKMDTGLTDDVAEYGTGYITSLELTAPAGDELSSFSGTISGTGSIVDTDPNV